MKQIYTTFVIFTTFFLLGTSSIAQPCACANGDPIDSIEQVRIMTGILPFTSTISFDKLNPSIGTLSCIRSRTTVFTRIILTIANRDTTSRVTYQYSYTRNTSLTGPGHSVSTSAPRMYGPFDLGQAGVDPDTVAVFGPDTLFNNIVMNRTSSTSLGSYVGTGPINFTYTNSAVAGFVIGNSNNQTTIADYSEVTVQLYYYFCPLIILKNQMREFTAVRDNNNVSVRWVMDSDESGNYYEVESSSNGKDFSAKSGFEGKGLGTQRYSYAEPLSNLKGDKVYFRVKLFDKNGKFSYSAVKVVYLGEQSELQPSVYPNPVVNEVNIKLATPQTGSLSAELMSMNGQVLQSRQFSGTKLTNIQFNLNRKYPSGAYFLRVKNAAVGSQSVTRIYIQ
ncbi:MAG: T9SS type A sorting domain-containing protein [Chitinophagaceae bacterium]